MATEAGDPQIDRRYLAALERGTFWSELAKWRADNPGANFVHANLAGVSFGRARLMGADLTGANLARANFGDANFRGARLTRAVLAGVDLAYAGLTQADLTEANCAGANLQGTLLYATNFSRANLSGAVLLNAVAIRTDFTGADLTGCSVYGLSAWDVNLEQATQTKLVITPEEPHVLVDDLEVAQFIYLLLRRQKLRNVLTTLGEKAVLILGRFTERKALLEGIADKVRSLGYLPIVFDFDRPTDRDLTETVKVLAGLSLFVVADITNPRSVPLELQATVPDYMVPFVTLVERGQPVFGMLMICRASTTGRCPSSSTTARRACSRRSRTRSSRPHSRSSNRSDGERHCRQRGAPPRTAAGHPAE